MLPTTRPQTTLTPRAGRDPLREFDRITRDLMTWASTWQWPDGDGALTALGDLEETDDAFVLELDLPGVAKGDVDVQLEGRRLTVRATRHERERVGILRHRTRQVGSYHHEVLLPADVDPDGIDADLTDGVLTVQLPKASTTRAHRIPVR